MLDFANRPPLTLQDVSLSDSGEALLSRDKNWPDHLRFYAKAAFTEIIDAIKEEPSASPSVEGLTTTVIDDVQSRLGSNSSTYAFAETMRMQCQGYETQQREVPS